MVVPPENGIQLAARRLASAGLPRTSGSRLEVPDGGWPGLLRLLTRQRITGLATAAVREGWLLLTEAQSTQLMDEHRSAMGMVLMLDHLLIDVAAAMAEAELGVVVLKGAAFAHAFYPDRSWRSYGDLDLLMSTPEWRRACDVLPRLGFERILPEPRPGFDERFGKGASFEDARKLQIDLHRTLALGPFGLWIDVDALLEGTTEFRLRDMSLRRLDDTNALIHACVHSLLGRRQPLLMPLRDVLQIAWSGGVDWPVLKARVAQWSLAAPVSRALATAASTLGAALPDEADQILTMPVGAIERRALRAYTTDRRRRGGMSVAALWAIHGFWARAAYVRAMVFPDRTFLRARASEGSGTIRRRLLIPLRWALERRRTDRGESPIRRRGDNR